MTHDVQSLRDQADALDVGEEALALYSQILDLDPDDEAAANMVGRSLQALGRDDEAREHWEFIVELQPSNAIAKNRLSSMQPAHEVKQVTTSRPTKPKRTPTDIDEPTVEGDGREPTLRLLAASIHAIEKIDPSRLSVTEKGTDSRFRIFAGLAPAVTPTRGRLHIALHGPAVSDELAAQIDALPGAETTPADDTAQFPESIEARIPMTELTDELTALLLPAHREHVLRTIAGGPPPWGHPHDPKVRDHIVKQASVT
jgi:tetratricopeptide (TPR) repeat protein